MLRAGDAAPDFVLKDADGKDVRLSSFSGKPIVVYFYPKDGTASCTLEAKGFRDHYENFQELGAQVVGVSMDSVTSHCDFRAKHHLPYPLLSDPEGRVHDLYEAWRTTLFGRRSLGVRRSTFLIDRDGIIRRVYKNFNVLLHTRQVIKDLERLMAQQAWGKGKRTETDDLLQP